MNLHALPVFLFFFQSLYARQIFIFPLVGKISLVNSLLKILKHAKWYWLQEISDNIIKNIVATLRNLQVLALCRCFGDISISGFKLPMPNLRKLHLELVTPWMNNNDLVILTQSCANLIELSLLGCWLLNSGAELFCTQRSFVTVNNCTNKSFNLYVTLIICILNM